MTTKPRKEDLLTVEEYADLVRCHPRQVYRRISSGKQPGAISVGRGYRINITVALVVSTKVTRVQK